MLIYFISKSRKQIFEQEGQARKRPAETINARVLFLSVFPHSPLLNQAGWLRAQSYVQMQPWVELLKSCCQLCGKCFRLGVCEGIQQHSDLCDFKGPSSLMSLKREHFTDHFSVLWKARAQQGVRGNFFLLHEDISAHMKEVFSALKTNGESQVFNL